MMQDSLFISNFKRYGKRIVSIMLLFGVLACCCVKYYKWAENPRRALYDFYRFVEKDTIDVLCIGSSHVYCGINPVQMYDDYGIAAYNLASGSQALWYSYYYLKEALKTQKPELIVLDVYTIVTDDDAWFDEKIQMNLLNMKPSVNKWCALKTAGEENIVDVFWQLPITHTIYSNFNKDTFDMRDGSGQYFLGYEYQTAVVQYDPIDVSGVTECKEISPKAEEYLRKSIELCQKEGIELVLTNTPWPCITEDWQKMFNYVSNIADEYGVEFINGCLHGDEIGLDYSLDSCGGYGHLNYSGVKKYTAWLTEQLMEEYEFPDRRGDDDYHHWELASRRLRDVVKSDQLKAEQSLEGYLECLASDVDRTFIIIYNGRETDLAYEIREKLEKMGIILDEASIYVVRDGEVVYNASAMEEYKYLLYVDEDVLYAVCDGAEQTVSLNRNNVVQLSNEGDIGVEIFSYNELLGGYSDIGHFSFNNSFIREY